MTFQRSQAFRLCVIVLLPVVLVLTGLVLLKQILLPFLVGMAAAYMLDPAADRLERLRFTRVTATALITGSFFLLLTVVVLLILPELGRQAADLASKLPNYVDQLRERLIPFLAGLIERVSGGTDFSAEGLIKGQASQAINVVMRSVTGLLQSGVALLNLVALMFVTPIVTFYLLRDWDHMVAQIRALVPPQHLTTADRLGREVDEVLAGFLRGQGMVCGFLAIFYAIGLEATKLDYGLIIGLLTGFFSFIPFIGMAIGMAVGLSVAAFQFQDLSMILVIAGIFGLGQFIEGNLISPRLVGSRIHLHPVWMIFSVLAGTTLFGFLGTLLAVPFAAVLGVLIRFGLERYQESALFDDSAIHADEGHAGHEDESTNDLADGDEQKKTGTLG
ncbi:MAG: AI-2E family transporter [Geminicoccaceae bacterium]